MLRATAPRKRQQLPPHLPMPLVLVVLVVLLLVSSTAAAPSAWACTSIMVGSGASTDGSIFISRNVDYEGVNATENLVYHPALLAPEEFQSSWDNLTYELAAGSLAYVGLPNIPADPAENRNASFEEAGINSIGVVMSSTETIYNSPQSLAADPYVTSIGVREDAIVSLVLPQAGTARQGVEVLGAIVQSQGAGEGFGVQFADKDEAWYFETASGHHWAARRLPSDSFFVSANQGRLQELNFTNNDTLASPGLIDFALTAQLWDPAAGPFNFVSAFMQNIPEDATYNYPRVRELQMLYAGYDYPNQDPLFPDFLKPTHQMSFFDVAQGLRMHYQGTPHDPYTNQNPSEPWRPIAVLRTMMSHITCRRTQTDLPDGLSVIMYVSMSMPMLSPFVPIYKGLPSSAFPPQLTAASSEPDQVSLFWKARRLQALVFEDFPLLAPVAKDAINAYERTMVEADSPAMEALYTQALQQGDTAGAERVIADFTQDVAARAGELLDALTQQAAEKLGLPAVPSDDELLQMVTTAEATYPFHGA